MTDFELSDVGNARRLVDRHAADLRYVSAWGWLWWNGRAWQRDRNGEVERRAVATVDAIFDEAARAEGSDRKKRLAQHALRSQSWPRVQAMVDAASSMAAVVALPEQFDTQPWLFNAANGTIDLRTGQLRPHRQEDLLTQLAPVAFDPGAQAPRFQQFLREIMAGDEAKVELLARAAGYSLTGLTSEQKLLLLHGSGANGKGTLFRILEAVLGPYHRKADVMTFVEMRSDRIREDIADLAGARMVSAEEPSKGHALDEGTVKKLTGSDTISARFLRRDRFTFRPGFKLWLAFNHKPQIRGADHGIWRRILLVNFPVTFDPPDPALEPALLAELPGVLAWMVQGCLVWQSEGLNAPDVVKTDTADYRSEQDSFGAFLEERCEIAADMAEGSSALFAAYASWADARRERSRLDMTGFGKELTERGFGKGREGGTGRTLRTGLRLRPLEIGASEPSSNGASNGVVKGVNSCEQFPLSPHARAREGVITGSGSQPFTPFTPFTTEEHDEAALTREALQEGA